MAILGGVATTYMAAGQAESDVDPTVTTRQALLATFSGWRYLLLLVLMGTGRVRHLALGLRR